MDSDNAIYGIIGFTEGGREFGNLVSEDDSGFSFGFGTNIGNFNTE